MMKMKYVFIKCVKVEKPISDKKLVRVIMKQLKGVNDANSRHGNNKSN